MATNLLSDTQVKKATSTLAKATKKNPVGTILKINKMHDGDGLYLWVFADKTKYWRMRYWIDGKEKLLSLGTYPEVSLSDAREKAKAMRQQHAAGVDPSTARKAHVAEKKVAAANSFEVVAREWFDKQQGTWVDSHTLDVKRRLKSNLFPYLGARPISDITPIEILATVQRIEARGAHDLAHRVLGVASQVFRYGVATKRCASDVTRDLRGALTPHVKANQHAVDDKQLPDLLRAVASYEQVGDKQTRLALQLLALTFVRTNELIGGVWTEFDLKKGIWVIPAERMKGKKEHLVPLSRQAVAILEQLKTMAGVSDYVLPGRNPLKPISNNTLLFALYRLGYKGKMTGHGFRAVASTYLYESNQFEPDWIERQLAHVESNTSKAPYNRAKYIEHRVPMMQAYADHLDSLIS
jgi:integrase